MSLRRVGGIVFWVSLLVLARAGAGPDREGTPEAVAEAVLVAIAGADAAGLAALASRDRPDPWLVADDLLRRGEVAAADGFARAAPRPDTEALPAHVASRRDLPDTGNRREQLVAAERALATGDANAALEAVGPAPASPPGDPTGVQLEGIRARAYGALRRRDEASAAFLRAAEAAERMGWLSRACDLLRQAGDLDFRRSAFAGARAAGERRLALCRRRGDEAGTLQSLISLAHARRNLGEMEGALAAYREAIVLAEALGDPAATAAALLGQANAWMQRGELEQAQAGFHRSREIFLLLGDAGAAATVLGNQGNVHYARGEFPQALQVYEQALREKETLGDRAGAVALRGSAANVHLLLGQHVQALADYERVLADMEALGDRQGAARARTGIGSAHAAAGDFLLALSAFERARQDFTALGDRIGAAGALTNVASVQHALGDHASALSAYERAGEALEAAGDRAGLARALGGMGNVWLDIGEDVRSLESHERSWRTLEEVGDRYGAARALGNLGLVHDRRGEHAEALAMYRRAFAASEALGDRAGAALMLGNIGALLDDMGDPTGALPVLQQALARQESLGDRAGTANVLGNLARSHRALGDLAAARSCFDGALALLDTVGDRQVEVRTLGNFALLDVQEGRWSQAAATARRAATLLARLVAGLAAEEGASAREPLAFVHDVGVQASLAQDDAEGVAWFLEAGRAGALLEGLHAREALWATTVPLELRNLEVKARVRETVAVAGMRRAEEAGDRVGMRRARKERQDALEEHSRVVGLIQREARAAAELFYPEPAPLADLRASLGPGDTLVLYGLLDRQACAVVVTPKDARLVDLGSSVEIRESVTRLALEDRGADPTAAVAELRDRIVAPLGLPPDVNRLLVSPDGVLGYVPFGTLWPGGAVAFVPSGTAYRRLREEEAKHGEGVLALGDPDYGTASGTRLVPLPASRDEALAVGTRTLLRAEATEDRLRAELSGGTRWRAVHFACHGLVDRERPARSSLALTASGEQDGLLTCLEVFRMPIAADLVVLSACETGQGRTVEGEGIVGFTRAFMFAGVPRVLCSLWRVDDEATRVLMTRFYEAWNPKDGSRGLSPAAALRNAQEHVASHEKWAHPYYWAAWVLWGLPD